MSKSDSEHLDPGATFPDGVPLTQIRAEVLSGEDRSTTGPMTPPPLPKRRWNTQTGTWESSSVVIPPDPSRASGEFPDASRMLESMNDLAGELKPMGTPVPIAAPPPPALDKEAAAGSALIALGLAGIGLMVAAAILALYILLF